MAAKEWKVQKWKRGREMKATIARGARELIQWRNGTFDGAARGAGWEARSCNRGGMGKEGKGLGEQDKSEDPSWACHPHRHLGHDHHPHRHRSV